MQTGVTEWIQKKYHLDAKRQLRQQLYPGEWQLELVIHHVKFEEELRLIESHGVTIHRLDDIIKELSMRETIIPSASGTDLLELIMLGSVAHHE
jgi:hypothetical protein